LLILAFYEKHFGHNHSGGVGNFANPQSPDWERWAQNTFLKLLCRPKADFLLKNENAPLLQQDKFFILTPN
jgi:hypothetical protein